MNAKAETQGYRFDAVKWLLVIGVVLGGVYANTYFAAEPMIYRVLGGVVLAGLSVAVVLQTAAGSAAWDLAREARVEIRKVVWPSREETTQTTLIVVAVVIFVALILWGLDSALSWLIKGVIG